jgi:hypothetical protein
MDGYSELTSTFLVWNLCSNLGFELVKPWQMLWTMWCSGGVDEVYNMLPCWSLQAFVRKVIELHDKYLQYVSECFVNHSLFHKVS